MVLSSHHEASLGLGLYCDLGAGGVGGVLNPALAICLTACLSTKSAKLLLNLLGLAINKNGPIRGRSPLQTTIVYQAAIAAEFLLKSMGQAPVEQSTCS